MAEQDQGSRCGTRRPEDAGDVVESELAFEDARVEASFGEEMHGRAFREGSSAALPDDLSPDRDPRGEHPCRNGHGYHLLVRSHGSKKTLAARASEFALSPDRPTARSPGGSTDDPAPAPRIRRDRGLLDNRRSS
jgi:hypothetical protein